jgi:hypothetical protein
LLLEERDAVGATDLNDVQEVVQALERVQPKIFYTDLRPGDIRLLYNRCVAGPKNRMAASDDQEDMASILYQLYGLAFDGHDGVGYIGDPACDSTGAGEHLWFVKEETVGLLYRRYVDEKVPDDIERIEMHQRIAARQISFAELDGSVLKEMAYSLGSLVRERDVTDSDFANLVSRACTPILRYNRTKHLVNTARHRPPTGFDSWMNYFRENARGRATTPVICPCHGCNNRLIAREGDGLPLGAHVEIRGVNGAVQYGITPVCSGCNVPANHPEGIFYLVTFFNEGLPSFAGRIRISAKGENHRYFDSEAPFNVRKNKDRSVTINCVDTKGDAGHFTFHADEIRDNNFIFKLIDAIWDVDEQEDHEPVMMLCIPHDLDL